MKLSDVTSFGFLFQLAFVSTKFKSNKTVFKTVHRVVELIRSSSYMQFVVYNRSVVCYPTDDDFVQISLMICTIPTSCFAERVRLIFRDVQGKGPSRYDVSHLEGVRGVWPLQV